MYLCVYLTVLQGRAVHDAVKPISSLIGRWKADAGQGSYPSIPTFQYAEEIEFGCLGQPMLTYHAFSWHPEKKMPMHMESGFLRINPGTNKLAFLVAHNFGKIYLNTQHHIIIKAITL